MNHQPQGPGDRLDRVEDLQAHAEHTSDQLSAVIAGLAKQLTEAERRIVRLEQRLVGLSERMGEFTDRGTEPPPHAAGPDIPREPL